MALTEKLTAVADAIRGKTGKSETLTLEQMATEITGIETGGGDTLSALWNRENESYSNDKVTRVPPYAFYYDAKVKSVSFPSATSIEQSAFDMAENLSSVNIPKAKTIGNRAFASTKILTEANFPEVGTIGQRVFNSCRSLVNVNIPNATRLNQAAFCDCRELTTIDLPKVTYMEHYVFQACGKLEVIILRSETLCSLQGITVLQDTPFASGGTGGTVYVPSSLMESYKTATNWSALFTAGSCNFVAIEGSEYE